MVKIPTAVRAALLVGAAVAVTACRESDASKSVALKDEELRPVATWQQVGVVKDNEITRVYVVNSRSGLVCEHEYLDSPTKPGRRFNVVSCSLPDSFYR